MKRDLTFIAITSIFFLSLGSCRQETQRNDSAIRNVILTEVEAMGDQTSGSYSGIVEEGKSVNVAFMTGGKLQTLNVKEGDRIRKGQLIATLDDADYLIGMNQLQVQFDQMTAEKKRMDEMYARHNIAPNDYEKFEAGYKQLELQLEIMKNKLGYTKLYSPSDGFVSYRYMQPGELVDAGTPIYKITDDTNLEVSVDLPLSVYLNRNDIKGAYGTVPSISGKIPLKMASFTPDADNNQLYHMKLDVPSSYRKELTTGMNMSVEIEMENRLQGETWIPSRSIFYDNGKTYVWVFNEKDSTLSKKEIIAVGSVHDNKSLVNGLSGDVRIVAAGVKQLKDGEKVNVVENPVQ